MLYHYITTTTSVIKYRSNKIGLDKSSTSEVNSVNVLLAQIAELSQHSPCNIVHNCTKGDGQSCFLCMYSLAIYYQSNMILYSVLSSSLYLGQAQYKYNLLLLLLILFLVISHITFNNIAHIL